MAPPTGPRILRTAVFWLLTGLSTSVGCFLALFALLFAPRTGRVAQIVERAWARIVVGSAGARLVVEGADRVPRGRPVVFVANHTSHLDPPALIASLPGRPRFVMKQELARVPFLGWYTWLGGHLFIDRSDPREGIEVLKRATARAHRYGLSPTIFPEGTRSRDGRLQDLKPGTFLLALSGGLDVQPVAVLGSHAVLPKGAMAPRASGDLVVRIGETIPTADLHGSAGRKALAARVRAALLALGVPAPETGADTGPPAG